MKYKGKSTTSLAKWIKKMILWLILFFLKSKLRAKICNKFYQMTLHVINKNEC